jgi:DNA polymerase-3 subunit chi
MTDVLFYHLERAALEDVLPGLLEKSRERHWRALVKVGSPERVDMLDEQLWTFREDSFLPHATAKDQRAAEQPIILTLADENPNGANICFYADGAMPSDWSPARFDGVTRIVVLFDGRDPAAMEVARENWKQARASGFEATYWQQTAEGRWEKRA